MWVDEPGTIDRELAEQVINLSMYPGQSRIFYSDAPPAFPFSVISVSGHYLGSIDGLHERYRLLTILRYILQLKEATP